MFSWTRLSHLAEWAHGRLVGGGADLPVKSISTDTRAIRSGEVFLALRGENFDGHAFVEEAVRRGAGAVVAERPFEVKVPQVIVDDGLRALVRIGESLRSHFKGKVAAVTGSAGKSSTKDMVAALLGQETVASPASFNNLMGVSRTLFLVQDSTRYLILEMGMNAFHEIETLCTHFRPQAGAITNIGDAHIGKLGGKRGIYQAKKELFDFLSTSGETLGIALNADDPLVQEAARESFRQPVPTVTYSAAGAPANVRVLQRKMDPATGFLSLTLEVEGKTLDSAFPIFGLHHAQNIAAAISLGRVLGLGLDEMRGRFDRIRPASHRGEVHAFAAERILIDESYNSNPTALTSSLSSLCDLDPRRRRVLVVGEMRELDDFSEKLHGEVGVSLAGLHAAKPFPFLLVGVGDSVSHLIRALKGKLPAAECLQLASVEEAMEKVPPLLRPRDVVFVKGSRGVKLDKLVAALLSPT